MQKSRILIGALALLFAGLAQAAQTGSTISVTASVQTNCRISSTGTVAFVNYDPTSTTDLTASGAVNFKCTKGTSANVTLDAGANSTGTAPNKQRNLTDGTNTLSYNLLKPTAVGASQTCTTTAWGDGTTASGTGFATSTTTGTTDTVLTVCGVIPNSQDVPAGSGYTDTVAVTVNF
jgi:spore coat protein U-like protein